LRRPPPRGKLHAPPELLRLLVVIFIDFVRISDSSIEISLSSFR
jgi:hypothetical protein